MLPQDHPGTRPMLYCSECGFGRPLDSFTFAGGPIACGCGSIYWQRARPESRRRRPTSLDRLSDESTIMREQLDYLIAHQCETGTCNECARRELVRDALFLIFE
jgi:hypothetical protein